MFGNLTFFSELVRTRHGLMTSSLLSIDYEKVQTHEITLNYLKRTRIYENKFSLAMAQKDRLMGP